MRGLANQVAHALSPAKVQFLQVDPHAVGSSSHGKSQKEVTKLFLLTIPEFAASGPGKTASGREAHAPTRPVFGRDGQGVPNEVGLFCSSGGRLSGHAGDGGGGH